MKWVRHIRDNCDAPPEIRALLLIMATYADAEGVCWPSLETLAGKLGIGLKATKARRKRAVDLGWLVIRSPGRWKGTSTRYQLRSKGVVDAPLSRSDKGGRGRPPKGVVDDPRTTKKAANNGAPSLARLSECQNCGLYFMDRDAHECPPSLGVA